MHIKKVNANENGFNVVVKILGYGEKPGNIGGIGRVEHVHTPL